MRIYISADLEGISGVTRRDDVLPPGQDYPAARRWLTADVNAAIAGARAAGATEFIVEENHGAELLCNLDLDLIDPEAEVVRGFPRHGMTTIAALQPGVDAVMLIGHHAAAGSPIGFLAHTISGTFAEVRLDGRNVGEGEMIALAAAELDIPTILVSGDDVTASQVGRAVPGVVAAVVKTAYSTSGGSLMPPARGAQLIREAADRAVTNLASGTRPIARPTPPYLLEIDLAPMLDDLHPALADVPGVQLAGRTLSAKVASAAQAWSIGVHAAAVVMPALLAAHRTASS